jgi:hypothetical protein
MFRNTRRNSRQHNNNNNRQRPRMRRQTIPIRRIILITRQRIVLIFAEFIISRS